MVYAYTFDYLGYACTHFDVRKGKERVRQFYEGFGAQLIAETELDYLYKLDGEAIVASRQRYGKLLDGTRQRFLKD